MEANILRILVLLIGVALVAVIMIQQPKEGGMGAFTGGGGGSGASSTVFGAKGSGSFLFRLTAGLVLGFAISIALLVKVTNSELGGSVLSTPIAEQQDEDKASAEKPADKPSATESIPGAEVPQSTGAESIPGAESNQNTGSETIPGTE